MLGALGPPIPGTGGRACPFGPMKPLAMEYIENLTFDEIAVGQSATLVRTLRHEDIQMFAVLSGDLNPTHVDPQYAKSAGFREVNVVDVLPPPATAG